MIIKTIPNGILQANTYVLIDEETKEAAIIDSGGEFEIINDALGKHGAKLKYILNTHAHFDHVRAKKRLKSVQVCPFMFMKTTKSCLKT